MPGRDSGAAPPAGNSAGAGCSAAPLGPAGEIMRLAGEEGERLRPKVVQALRGTLSRYARPNGVWAPSSTWFISSRNPA